MSIFFRTSAAMLLLWLMAANVSAQSQSTDKEFLEQWAQRNPQVQWLSARALATYGDSEQMQMRTSGQYLIYEGDFPTQAEIESFEQTRRISPQQNPSSAKQKWYAEKRRTAAAGAPATTAAAPKIELTRTEMAAMPESKRQYVLAHPEIYTIKD